MSMGRGRTAHSTRSVAATLVLVAISVIASSVAALTFVGAAAPRAQVVHGAGSDPPYVVTSPPAPIVLSSPGSVAGGFMGRGVAVVGQTVVTGAPNLDASGVTAAGQVFVTNLQTGATITLLSPAPTPDAAFGYSVAYSGGYIAVGAPGANVSGRASGEAFVFSASTYLEVASFVPPVPQEAGYYGFSVALSGSTLVVGAPLQDAAGVEAAGNAYFYNIPTGLTAAVQSPTPASNGYFGYSVSISGNLVAIGSPGNPVGIDSGAGSAYEFNAYTGDLVRTVVSPDPVGYGNLGYSVAIAGDVLAVGAPWESAYPLLLDSGVVELLNLQTGSEVNLTPPAPTDYDFFGSSVAISGTTVAVGAYAEPDPIGVVGGMAYAFSTFDGVRLSSTLASTEPARDGQFGSSIAIAGSVIVVGAYNEGGTVDPSCGHAYVFRAPEETLSEPGGYSDGQSLGLSVAASGEYVVMGAPYYDVDSGSAWIVDKATGVETQLTSPVVQDGGRFGTSVAIGGGVVAVGEPGYSTDSNTSLGIIYIYSATTGQYLRTLSVPSGEARTNMAFGSSVAISGQYVLGGAPGAYDYTGLALLFGGSGFAYMGTFFPTSQPGANTGASVALNGTTLAIGIPYVNYTTEEINDPEAGEVYLYNISTGVSGSFASPNPQTDGQFGASVALTGTGLLVGAPGESSGGVASAGNAYLYAVSGGVDLVSTYTSPDATVFGDFGTSVALQGITAVVGAPGEEFSSTYRGVVPLGGNVYVFNTQTGLAVDTFSDPNAIVEGDLGRSVAVTSTFIVAGAPYETSYEEYGSGFVYIF